MDVVCHPIVVAVWWVFKNRNDLKAIKGVATKRLASRKIRDDDCVCWVDDQDVDGAVLVTVCCLQTYVLID